MSRPMRLASISCLLSFATCSLGQQAVSPEDAVLDQIRACNDGWVESIRRKDFGAFESACPLETGATFWYPNDAEPVELAGADGLWARQSPELRAIAWEDLELVGMRIVDDLALVYYTVTWIPETLDAEPVRLPSRRFTVLRNVDDAWLTAGGTIMEPP